MNKVGIIIVSLILPVAVVLSGCVAPPAAPKEASVYGYEILELPSEARLGDYITVKIKVPEVGHPYELVLFKPEEPWDIELSCGYSMADDQHIVAWHVKLDEDYLQPIGTQPEGPLVFPGTYFICVADPVMNDDLLLRNIIIKAPPTEEALPEIAVPPPEPPPPAAPPEEPPTVTLPESLETAVWQDIRKQITVLECPIEAHRGEYITVKVKLGKELIRWCYSQAEYELRWFTLYLTAPGDQIPCVQFETREPDDNDELWWYVRIPTSFNGEPAPPGVWNLSIEIGEPFGSMDIVMERNIIIKE